jgi:hypothetical protein
MRSSYLTAALSWVAFSASWNLLADEPLNPANPSLPDSRRSVNSEKSDESDTDSVPFNREILKAAAEYKSWGRVDDEFRWAPTLCRLPKPGRAYASASDEEQTHGKKLYSLFARERNDYVTHAEGRTVNVGQVVVKQSWLPEEITDAKERPGKPFDDNGGVVSRGASRGARRKTTD